MLAETPKPYKRTTCSSRNTILYTLEKALHRATGSSKNSIKIMVEKTLQQSYLSYLLQQKLHKCYGRKALQQSKRESSCSTCWPNCGIFRYFLNYASFWFYIDTRVFLHIFDHLPSKCEGILTTVGQCI